MKNLLKNENGALTIATIVMISSIFIIMMSASAFKIMESNRRLQHFKMKLAGEFAFAEIAQKVSTARAIRRAGLACPAGTVLGTFGTAQLCVPNTDGDGNAEASDFCFDKEGFRYCLDTLTKISTDSAVPFVLPGAYGPTPFGSSLSPGTLQTRNSMDPWSPEANWIQNNEMYNPVCGDYTFAAQFTRYWLGCNYCETPGSECFRLRACRAVRIGSAPITACAAAEAVIQDIMLYNSQ